MGSNNQAKQLGQNSFVSFLFFNDDVEQVFFTLIRRNGNLFAIQVYRFLFNLDRSLIGRNLIPLFREFGRIELLEDFPASSMIMVDAVIGLCFSFNAFKVAFMLALIFGAS